MSPKTKKIFLFISLLFACFAAVHFALAQSANELVFGGQEGAISNVIGLGSEDPRVMVAKIIRVALGFLGIIALGLIIYAGYVWMTAGGNEENIEKAKKILTGAVIGLVIILASFAIASYILNKLLEATGGGGGGGGCEPPCTSGQYCCSGSCQSTPCSTVPPGATSFYVTSTSPANGSQDVILNAKVRFNFNTAVDAGTVSNSTFKVTDANGDITGNLATDGSRIIFTPSGACPTNPCGAVNCLPANKDITVKAENGASGILSVGNNQLSCVLGQPCEITFKTGETVDCANPTINLDFIQVCVSANNVIGANSSDDSAVSYIDFYVDSVFKESQNNPSYSNIFNTSFNWDGSSYTVGENISFKANVYDADDHVGSDTKTASLRPEHCCNGVKDGDEEGVDCGGECAGCVGAACATDKTGAPAASCNDDLCASGFCTNTGSSQASCVQAGYDSSVTSCCLCQSRPRIDWVSPEDGKPGNLITIGGANFGTTAGKVWFGGGDGNGDLDYFNDGDEKEGLNPVTVNAKCTDYWQNDQIVIVVPAGVEDGPIKVKAANNYEDATNDDFGNLISDFDINSTVKPGLCLADPDNGYFGDTFNLQGIQFSGADRSVKFGSAASSIAAGGINFSSDKSVDATIPNVQTGNNTVFVIAGGENSNYLRFNVLYDAASAPIIDYIDPIKGPPEQYITIYGSNFKSYSAGASKVIFKYRATNATTTADGFGFPEECQNSWWQNDHIIVKVPNMALPDIDFGNYDVTITNSSNLTSAPEEFEVTNESPGPGLCELKPHNGPVNTSLTAYGDNFGNSQGSGFVKFYNNIVNASISNWKNQEIKTAVPTGAETGPVAVSNGTKISNSIPFAVGTCTGNNECYAGEECCLAGTFWAGVCRDAGTCNAGAVTACAYGWTFSTGANPNPPLTCGGYTNAEACAASGSCPNSPGECQTKTEITMGECGDAYCDQTYPQCAGACFYDSTINKCNTQESCDQTSAGIISGYTAECRNVGGANIWQINTSASCPTGSFRDTNNWCTIGSIGSPQLCTACASGLSCQNGQCVINQTICPSGSTCDLTAGSATLNKCLSNDICECCCRVNNSAQDCCAGLTCEAGGCGSDPVNYGLCTGCKVEINGAVDQTASDNACNCDGGASRYCVIDSTYPNGACQDRQECDSNPATSACEPFGSCALGEYCDTDCLCKPATPCDSNTNTSACEPNNNLCAGGNSSQECDPATCLCQPKYCTDNPTQCSEPFNCSAGEYCDTSSCLCKAEGGGPGAACILAIKPTCTEGEQTCLTDYSCLSNGDCLCCCTPGETNAAGLQCVADKTPCTGEIRGLYCGCSSDDQCGNLDFIGCSFDTCCRERPEITSMSPEDGATNVCRNTAISATFNQYMDISSLSGNVVVIGDYGSASCPAGTEYILSSESGQKGFFGRVFARVSNALKEMANVIFHRARAMTGNFCAIAGTVSGVNNADETSTLTFYPSTLLDADKKYYVIIKGDGDLTDVNKAGVKSYYDIAMADDWTDLDNNGSIGDNDRTFNGVKFYGKIWSFTTKNDSVNNGICEINRVEIDPASYLFQTTSNDLNEDDMSASADSFDTVADRDKLFTARALSADGLELSSVAGVYEWSWSWNPPPSSSVANFSTTVTGLFESSKLVEAVSGVTDAQTDITAKATITAGGSGEFSAVAPIWIFVCENPWPAVVGGLWAPWQESGNNCTVPSSGNCSDTNYNIYYCRDAGGAGTADDLPAVISEDTIIRGSSTIQNFLKEFYFFREEAPALSGIAPSGMLSYWRLDETSGTTAVDSVGGRNGTMSASASGWTWSDGYVNGAVNFPTNNFYFEIADTDFPSGNSPRSIEAWFKAAATNNRQPLFFYGTPNTNGGDATYILMWEDGRMCVGDWGGINEKCTAETYNNDAWHHAVFTFDGTNAKLYMDGSIKLNYARTYNTTLTSSAIISGSPVGDRFIGSLDEIAIYDRALSAAEVSDHFQSGSYFSNLILTDQTINSDGKVYANWDEITGSGITGYKIYYGTKSNDYDNYKTVTGSTNTSYLVTGLTVGKTYYFNITATYPNAVESAYLGEKSIEVKDEGAPAMPSGLTATKSCEGEIDIKWNDNPATDEVTGYKVYYGAVSGQYGGVEDVGDALEAALTGLTTGNTYYIAVSAYDSSGNESAKAEINGGQGIVVSDSCQ